MSEFTVAPCTNVKGSFGRAAHESDYDNDKSD